MLIVRCANVFKNPGTYLRASYFAFENDFFKKVFEEIGQDRVF